MTIAQSEKNLDTEPVLEMARTFNAPINRVFEAFTDPAIMQKWWGYEGVRVIRCNSDTVVGGSYLIELHAADGTVFIVSGTYTKVNSPTALEFTWAWHQGGERGPETTVKMAFTSDGDKTNLHLWQGTFTDGCTEHYKGWFGCFERVEGLL